MSNPVTLTLTTPQGAFVFADAEVPEKIAIGGTQLLTVHKLVGGLRVLDAMGPDDSALSWSGWFLGSSAPGDDSAAPLPDTQSATGRARFLDGVRRAGLPCTLSWGEFSYQVVVSQFSADYEKPYKVAYRITCEVVQDQTQSVSSTASGPTSPTDAIAQDSAALGTLAASVDSAALSGLVGSAALSTLSAVTGAAKPIANGLVSLGTAASSVSSAAGAAASVLSAAGGAAVSVSSAVASVAGAVASASSALSSLQSTVASLAAGASAAVAAIPSIGGANPLQSVVQQAAAMSAQAAAAVQLSTLQQMGNVATRLQSNLALVANPGGNRQATTGGGNLYQAAAQAYGDATRWSDIAQASGLTDPMTPGFNTITLP